MRIEVSNDAHRDQGEWFAPDFEENRELAPDARALVLIVAMSGADKLRIDHMPVLATKADKKIKDIYATVSRREWAKQRKILEERVIGFKNWERVDPETKQVVQIDNAKDWVAMLLASKDARHAAILDQVYNAILDRSVLADGVLGESV